VNNLIYGTLLFAIAQTVIWFQTNLQFFNPWAKEHPLIMASVFSIPISYMFIRATAFVVEHFDGLLWPGRFIAFATGMVSFAILSYVFLGEGLGLKTAVSVVLAIVLVLVQLLWK